MTKTASAKAQKTDAQSEGPERQGRGQGRTLVYTELRNMILSLELKPGAPLDEMQLSRQFSMSRSPIREALNRLAAENLVVMLANRSTLVAPMDFAQFPRYVEALDLQQRINTRLAAQNRSEADLEIMLERADAFEDSVSRYNHLEMSAANMSFHMAVADAGGNPYLARQYEQLLNEGRRMLHLHFDYLRDSGQDELLTREHHEMVDAIRDRDVELADKLAHAHTRQFHRRFMAFMETNFDDDFQIDLGKMDI